MQSKKSQAIMTMPISNEIKSIWNHIGITTPATMTQDQKYETWAKPTLSVMLLNAKEFL